MKPQKDDVFKLVHVHGRDDSIKTTFFFIFFSHSRLQYDTISNKGCVFSLVCIHQ
jgi:hypothetical protein